LARSAPFVARAQVAAAVFDAIENLSLLGVLGNRDPRLPAVARACARAKFALLLLGWAYSAAGLVSHLSGR
jgi:hypothetical protein